MLFGPQKENGNLMVFFLSKKCKKDILLGTTNSKSRQDFSYQVEALNVPTAF